jgi:isopentenyl-diphosphate Delta-isomerase
MIEFLDVVDHNDNVIARRSRPECIDNGLLHRAVTVFIANDKGEVFLQKRAKTLRFYPGRWTASCTGHVSAGETYRMGAERELSEELGIKCELKELGKFMTPKWKIENGTEWEFITVYAGTWSGVITLSNESEEGKFVSSTEFRRLAEMSPETFTPDLMLALKYYPRLSG